MALMIEAVLSLGHSVSHVHEQFPVRVQSNRIQIDGEPKSCRTTPPIRKGTVDAYKASNNASESSMSAV